MTLRRQGPTKIRLLDSGAAGEATTSTSRTVTVVASTESLGRDDIVLISGGIDLTNYRTNPVVLWQHDPACPIGRATEIGVIGTDLVATVEFAPEGVSHHADTVYGLIKAGVINAASTGFETREAEPLDPANPRTGGIRITACELQEFSFVSIPACPDALITERAMQEVRNRMTTPAVTIEPSKVEKAMKARMIERGLYGVANLACLLEELGWQKDSAAWEAEIEQDGSTIPAQLGEALKVLGAVLVSMVSEEVAELIGGDDVEIAGADEAVIVQQSKTPSVARFRVGIHRARAPGKAPPTVITPVTSAAQPQARSASYHRRMAALYAIELRRSR